MTNANRIDAVYEIANTLVLERASRDEFRMALFGMLADIYWPTTESVTALSFYACREFARLVNIGHDEYQEINFAASRAFV